MSDPYRIQPVVRFCGVIARQESVRDWGVERLTERWGQPFLRFPTQPFDAGGYYREEMGDGLGHDLVAFDGPADPAELADWKLETNAIESDARKAGLDTNARPINLDCGYITQAKFVLATMKNRSHRIYLRNAVFAEITLTYVRGRWQSHPQTYPNYRTDEIADFAMQAREQLRSWVST